MHFTLNCLGSPLDDLLLMMTNESIEYQCL